LNVSDGSDSNLAPQACGPTPERLLPALDFPAARDARGAAVRLPQQARHPAAAIALPDRRQFRARLEDRLARSIEAPLALLYLELDPIDADAPDAEALRQLTALRLAHALRSEDVVGRIGPEQFACLLSGTPSRSALDRVARRLGSALSAPLQLGPLRIGAQCHIGIAVCPRDGATAGVLLKHADEATFRARAHASGYAFFDPRLDP
jgi:diguanylate cyclase (GGDEF)-like protein